jgi:hypothetical protein
MPTDKVQGIFAAWFDRLVKNKMVALAIPVCGISLSCFLLSFAKLFSDSTLEVINNASLIIFVISGLQFVLVGSFQIMILLKLISNPARGKALASKDNVPSATAIEDRAAT